MARTRKLNDLQLVLLATAAQREDGSILPPADSIADQQERIQKTLPLLLRRGLIEEVPIKDRKRAWREEYENPIGLVITSAGRAIIDAADEESGIAPDDANAPAGESNAPSPNARTGTKAELVIELLQRAEGATLAELVDATGWLPHTTRAALTGIRKKGHSVEKTKRDKATCYHIAETA